MPPKPDPSGPQGLVGARETPLSLLNKRKPVPTPRSTLRKAQKDDILTALENIPGVGSLRSLNKEDLEDLAMNKVRSQTLGIRKGACRVPRDESSHSLGFSTPNKVEFRVNSTSCSPTSQRSPRDGTSRSDTSAETKSSSLRHDSGEDVDSARKSVIQERPLPDLPEMKVQSQETQEEAVYTSLLTPSSDHYQELKPKIIKNMGQDGNLTLSGTIKRGKFKERAVDVTLTLTEQDLSKIEQRVNDKFHDRIFCGFRRGPHVFILSLLSCPIIWIYATVYNFFLGSMTWYNIFIHYNEERTCCHKLLSPLVLLLYPFWIAPVTMFLGIYRGLSQISWYWDSWTEDISNPDCGFMGWACAQLNLPDCSPYQTVFIGDMESLHHDHDHSRPTPI